MASGLNADRHGKLLMPQVLRGYTTVPIYTSVLPLAKSGVAVGGFLTSMIKGKSLFIPRYRKDFGIS